MRHRRCELAEEQEKIAEAGFNKCPRFLAKENQRALYAHRMGGSVESEMLRKTRNHGWEESMQCSKKSDEVITANMFRAKALLIGSNFW